MSTEEGGPSLLKELENVTGCFPDTNVGPVGIPSLLRMIEHATEPYAKQFEREYPEDSDAINDQVRQLSAGMQNAIDAHTGQAPRAWRHGYKGGKDRTYAETQEFKKQYDLKKSRLDAAKIASDFYKMHAEPVNKDNVPRYLDAVHDAYKHLAEHTKPKKGMFSNILNKLVSTVSFMNYMSFLMEVPIYVSIPLIVFVPLWAILIPIFGVTLVLRGVDYLCALGRVSMKNPAEVTSKLRVQLEANKGVEPDELIAKFNEDFIKNAIHRPDYPAMALVLPLLTGCIGGKFGAGMSQDVFYTLCETIKCCISCNDDVKLRPTVLREYVDKESSDPRYLQAGSLLFGTGLAPGFYKLDSTTPTYLYDQEKHPQINENFKAMLERFAPPGNNEYKPLVLKESVFEVENPLFENTVVEDPLFRETGGGRAASRNAPAAVVLCVLAALASALA